MTARGPGIVGTAVPRKEGVGKVTGAATYLDDLTMPGIMHGVTARSTIPRGRIRAIRFDPSFPWHECIVVSAADIPGSNHIALIDNDQPCLAAGLIEHPEEPVALIAHADRYTAEAARRAVSIEYDELTPVFDPEQATRVFKRFLVSKGDIGRALAEAPILVEGEYRTGAQEQLYIEPQAMLAVASPADGVTVWGSMQCPYYVHKALLAVFGLPADKVRVVQTETGGGFGGKEEYPSMIAAHAALLAWKAGRPVKMVYDRAEDIAATTKRHPSRTRIRTGLTSDGRLVAIDIDFLLDGGAYCTLSPVVLSRGTIHAAGPYACDHVRIEARAVKTNHPPHGAFRGFGAPQSIFALERHMDRAAGRIGMDPAEFRRRNFLHQGDTTATGQILHEDPGLEALLDRALAESGYQEKRRTYAQTNPGGKAQRGVGLAAFFHGAGFTGSGERYLQSEVTLERAQGGKVRILVSSTEIGQGTNTILCQIAAEALGVSYDDIEMVQPDTAAVPNSGPTVASRTCMVVGRLVEQAARRLDSAPGSRATATYEPPPGIYWDDEAYRGDAYGAYGWAVYVASVAADARTGEVTVEDFVAVQEVGRVIHPVLATGQIEGGVAQGIGWALWEHVAYRDGRVANARMTDYIMPTSCDLPPLRVFFLERPYEHGPFGAKGLGELPMDGPAPAIANAVSHALAIDANEIPLLAERVLDGIEAAEAHA